MKHRVCLTSAIALGLTCIGFSSFSAQTIYGLDNARHFRSHAKSDFYIQLGSFKHKNLATRAKTSFQKQSRHPVLLKEKNGYYTVLMGPMHSAADVRTIAQSIGNSATHARVVTIQKHPKPIVSSSPNQIKAAKKASVTVYKDKDGLTLPANKWFVGLGAGWMSPFGTNATLFAPSGMPGFPDDRYAGEGSKGAGQYSIFAGYQWRRPTEWLPAYSLSLQYTYTASASVNGFIYVNNLPDSRNFTYKYDVSQQLPMAKLKLDLYRWNQFMPYISGAAGVAFNRGHNYSDAPIPGETLMLRRYGFNAATQTEFAGTFGAGLDYWLNDRGQLSLGYELSYYGNASTGNGQGVLSASHLGNKLNANAVILQGSYFCDW
jgi:opacity protein-like surface antigen